MSHYNHILSQTESTNPNQSILVCLLGWCDFGGSRFGGSNKERRVKVVKNEVKGHDQLRLVGGLFHTLTERCVHEQVEARGRTQGREHGLLQAKFLNGIQTLVHGQKGSSTSGNGTTENRSKQGQILEFGWWDSGSGGLDQGTHHLGAVAFVHGDQGSLENGRQSNDFPNNGEHFMNQKGRDKSNHGVRVQQRHRDGVDQNGDNLQR